MKPSFINAVHDYPPLQWVTIGYYAEAEQAGAHMAALTAFFPEVTVEPYKDKDGMAFYPSLVLIKVTGWGENTNALWKRVNRLALQPNNLRAYMEVKERS